MILLFATPFTGRPMRFHCSPFLSAIMLISLTSLLAACGEPADTHPDQPVTHRRAAMKQILLAFEPMGVQLRDESYKADAFLARAQELAGLKDKPWAYFGADTNYPPTHAKPELWSEPAHFEAEKQEFLKAADALLVAAESRDEALVRSTYTALHDSCASCHKAFKR